MIPNNRLTRGAVAEHDLKIVYQTGYSKSIRRTPGSVKAKVYREYGLTTLT
jgi:hypothetical protein